MKTLEIIESNARKAFKKADKSGKELLNNLFGSETFSQKITDLVKTFEDACEVLNIETHGDAFAILKMKNRTLLAEIPITRCDDPVLKIMIVIAALNEGWKPNWNNSNEPKYYPWFNMGGSGLSYYVFDYSVSYTGVGSRLCLKSSELAEYAGKQFLLEYQEFLTQND